MMTTINYTTRHREQIILLSLCGILLLTISKDLLHSFINEYPFYLSESMLFGMFWMLFVPISLVNKKILDPSNKISLIALPILFSVLHLFVFSLLVYTISGLFFNHTFSFSIVLSESFADNILTCLLLYGLLGIVFMKVKKFNVDSRKSPDRIRVNFQNKVLLISFDDILYVKTERPYIALVTHDKTYLHNSTLKNILEKDLPPNFAQIHRSTVVNTDHITSYVSRKNGDYDILMVNGDSLRASRNFNALFKTFSKAPA